MRDLFTTFFAVIAGILVYRYRMEIWRVLERFDRRNRARIEEEERDRGDSLAHFRHTLRLAEEQVEEVSEVRYSDSRTATPLIAYVFEGQRFPSRERAEEARAEKIRTKAREFYRELPLALQKRGDDRLN
jgi:hypothetical protein